MQQINCVVIVVVIQLGRGWKGRGGEGGEGRGGEGRGVEGRGGEGSNCTSKLLGGDFHLRILNFCKHEGTSCR